MRTLFISLVAVVFMAGCSTPQTRARSHAEMMATLSPEERAQVEAGEIDLGFTEEMVLVALGKPDRKSSRRTEEGERMVWAYQDGGLPGVSFGLGVGGGSGGYGGGVSMGTRGGGHTEERLRVVFAEGQVIAIERAEP